MGYFFEDLTVGLKAEVGKTISETDLVLFAGVSLDVNPLHLDEEFARGTLFKGRIAHGMISASLISAAIGNKLPGPGSIYLSQTLRFRAPVRIGDTVHVIIEVTGLDTEKKRATLSTLAYVNEKLVVEGEASVIVPSKN